MYVRCKLCYMKVQTIQKISCSFREKIQSLQNVNILGSRFNSSGTPFLKIPIPKDPKDVLCQNWLKLAQLFWRRSRKCEKFIDRKMDRQTTNNRWSEKLTRAFMQRLGRKVAYKKEWKIISVLYAFLNAISWIELPGNG